MFSNSLPKNRKRPRIIQNYSFKKVVPIFYVNLEKKNLKL